jgi:hypothetical protein
MALNPYFLHGSTSEQRLVQDLVNEQLRMFGQEIVYMPRQFITEKKIVKEILVSKFNDSFNLEAYLANPSGFGGQGDIISKFIGVRSTDEVTFIISKERFEDFISPFIVDREDIKLSTRPQEGDLIYWPLDNGLFEIKYVQGKTPFYQLNNLYVYELKCELFEYEDEIIDTGMEEVDNSVKDFGYTITLNMVKDNAKVAEAYISQTVNNAVSYVEILNGGYGFKSTPEVKIEKPGINGTPATAVAIVTTRYGQTSIDKILITNPGAGYTFVPNITLVSNSGSGFVGICSLSTQSLGSIIIVDPGLGYPSAPVITLPPPSIGEAAHVVSTTNSEGEITSIRYINSGSGYDFLPSLDIPAPQQNSSGTYAFNEEIYGDSTGTRGYVKEWDEPTRTLKVSIVNGNFALGERIVGIAASYNILSIDTYDRYDAYESNQEIETEADTILDFSESNPFGEF